MDEQQLVKHPVPERQLQYTEVVPICLLHHKHLRQLAILRFQFLGQFLFPRLQPRMDLTKLLQFQLPWRCLLHICWVVEEHEKIAADFAELQYLQCNRPCARGLSVIVIHA